MGYYGPSYGRYSREDLSGCRCHCRPGGEDPLQKIQDAFLNHGSRCAAQV